MKISSFVKKALTVAAILIVVATFFFQPATVAYADDPYLDSNVPSAGMTNKDIEYMNKHILAWMKTQGQVFVDMHDTEIDFQALIDLQIQKKGDAQALEVALDQFMTDFHIAWDIHNEAAKIIGTQWGFDAQGHVTNREAALKTVTDGRYYLRDARFRMLESLRMLKRDYAAWRYKHIHR